MYALQYNGSAKKIIAINYIQNGCERLLPEEGIGGVRPFVTEQLKGIKGSWSLRMLLSREAGSEVKVGSLREQCVWVRGFNASVVPTYARMRMCDHVYASTCAGRDYARHNMDPSGQAFAGQVPVDRGSRRKEDDKEGRCLLWRWGPAEK